jgi:hypothetical protein
MNAHCTGRYPVIIIILIPSASLPASTQLSLIIIASAICRAFLLLTLPSFPTDVMEYRAHLLRGRGALLFTYNNITYGTKGRVPTAYSTAYHLQVQEFQQMKTL